MILATQHFDFVLILEPAWIIAVHVNSGHAEMKRLGARLYNPASPIVRPLHLLTGGPPFLESKLYQARKIPVELAIRAIGRVEPSLHLGPWGHVLDFRQERDAALDQIFSATHDLAL